MPSNPAQEKPLLAFIRPTVYLDLFMFNYVTGFLNINTGGGITKFPNFIKEGLIIIKKKAG